MSTSVARSSERKTLLRFRDENGQTMIMLTVAFATMLALMGLVFDGGRIYYEKRRLQAAADAGAFAAVQELRRGHRAADTQVKPAARRDIELNGYTSANATITIDYPSTNATFPGANYAVVTLERPVATTFMRIFNQTASTVRAQAVAGLELGGDPCVVALRQGNSNDTLRVTGNGGINAQCGLYVNSNGSGALDAPMNGGGVNATWAGVVGGNEPGNYNIPGGIKSDTTGYDMPAIPDPLAAISEPVVAGLPTRSRRGYCDAAGTIPRGNGAGACQPAYFIPGKYAQNVQLTSSGTAYFAPGLYDFEDGLDIQGSWNVYSTGGVTFYMNGGGSPSKGIQITTSGMVQLTAPNETEAARDGSIQGILLFGARSNSWNNATNKVGRAQNGSYFSGAIYFPSEHIDWAGNSDAYVDAEQFSMVIADTIDLSGSSGLNIFRKPTSLSNAPTIYRVALVR